MQFLPTRLDGAYLIELDKREDERGFFARLFCEREFAEAGLETRFVQINNSLSRDRGTLRGMHYQLGEAAEVKIVSCVRSAIDTDQPEGWVRFFGHACNKSNPIWITITSRGMQESGFEFNCDRSHKSQ